MVQWDKFDRSSLVCFAARQMSGRGFVSSQPEEGHQEADRLVRKYGVTYSQRLARKSLRRRGIDIRLTNV
jgi:hypothetical protein